MGKVNGANESQCFNRMQWKIYVLKFLECLLVNLHISSLNSYNIYTVNFPIEIQYQKPLNRQILKLLPIVITIRTITTPQSN